MKNYLFTLILALSLGATIESKAQVPILSSHPSAAPVIFLDFDGQTVSGTSWNYAGPLYLNNSGLTTTQIIDVFNRVAEDYRPFNINITTDSTKYFAAPIAKRMRVILTTSHEWYGSAGGVAFVNSFVWGDNTPCFVFSALLGNSKWISEATSHEAGHTLGLYHQSRYDPVTCDMISDYHSGTGVGEIGWAPIMGVGYYKNLTLWNNGPNSYGCNSIQSDLSVILSKGITFRSDDHAATLNNQATNTPFVNNLFSVNGIIEQSTDMDNFKVTQPAVGRFQLSAIPYNVGTGNSGSNLDLQVSLYNNAGALIATYNPGTLLSSVIDTILNPGTYYLSVEGKGNINAPNYASLGSYALQGAYLPVTTLPLRRLELSGELVGDKHKLNWLIDADEQVVRQVLEVATDGRNFSAVTTPTTADRNFLYKPFVSSAAQYRLNVTFDNGKQHYSNVITLRGIGSTIRPSLLTNIVSGTAVTVKSPGNYSYIVFDMYSKIIAKGQLSTGLNNINADRLPGGMYTILYTNGTEQWSDKFVRH